MKKTIRHAVVLMAILVLIPLSISAQTDELKTRVDDLVFKHYVDGIQYVEANALGDGAVPYLVELLDNTDVKEYWVNIIVTLGFIESSSALNPLVSFLEENRKSRSLGRPRQTFCQARLRIRTDVHPLRRLQILDRIPAR